MTKSSISKSMEKFLSRTTKPGSAFDKARKAERVAMGIPLDIGTKGIAVVSAIVMDETKANDDGEKFPRGGIELKVETPEASRGKSLSGFALQTVFKDSAKPDSDWTAEDAFGMFLGRLEQIGCPEELTQGYESFQDVIDWFEESPRRVSYEVIANPYKDKNGVQREGKNITMYTHVEPSTLQSADDAKEVEEDSEASYCTFNGVKHKITLEQDDTLNLINTSNGRVRTGIKKERVEMIEA